MALEKTDDSSKNFLGQGSVPKYRRLVECLICAQVLRKDSFKRSHLTSKGCLNVRNARNGVFDPNAPRPVRQAAAQAATRLGEVQEFRNPLPPPVALPHADSPRHHPDIAANNELQLLLGAVHSLAQSFAEYKEFSAQQFRMLRERSPLAPSERPLPAEVPAPKKQMFTFIPEEEGPLEPQHADRSQMNPFDSK